MNKIAAAFVFASVNAVELKQFVDDHYTDYFHADTIQAARDDFFAEFDGFYATMTGDMDGLMNKFAEEAGVIAIGEGGRVDDSEEKFGAISQGYLNLDPDLRVQDKTDGQ